MRLSTPLDRFRQNRQLAAGVLAGSALALLVLVRAYGEAGSGSSFLQFTLVGISLGCVYAVAASGLVLTYTTTGVFNFAHGAVGMAAAFLYYQVHVEWDVPTPFALAAILLVYAPLMGLLLERIMRSFRGAPPGTALTVTIGLTILLIGVIQATYQAHGEQNRLDYIWGERFITVFGARLNWDEVTFFVVAVVAAIGLRYLLKATRTGVAMRAVVDNPDLAALTGAPPITIARTSWVLGSVLASLAGVLYAAGNILDAINLTFFVIAAYGAAVFGRLRSLALTFAGAIVLGLVQGYAPISFPKSEVWNHLQVGVPGIFLFLVLLALPEAKLTVGRLVSRDVPPVPRFASTVVRGVLFIPLVLAAATVAGDYLGDLSRGLIYGTLLLSLVLLTGYSGQISLAQYVFFGLGAFAMAKVAGGDSILGLAAAAAIAVPLGVITALPALRLQGLYLALVTFALAQISRDVIFQDTRIYGKGGVEVGRLELFGLDFSGDRAFAVLCGIVFALVGIGVLALRRGAFGRRLAAMRDSQAACATLGLDVRRTKLAVFALSSAIAGLAGALYGGLGFTASQLDFEPLYNVLLFLFAYVGGITTVTGALLGGLLFAALPFVQSEYPEYAGLVFAVIAIGAVALGKQPNGLAGILFSWTSRFRTPQRPPATTGETPAEPPATTRELADAPA
ncbi:MAG TPA: ABC transporter permease [Acidimicrobiales bacterium]|nr:ABC transporter permease [Acidimicrobiales bacterium]